MGGTVGLRAALVVFAKEPVPGRVKTRLVPPFSPQQASDFYAAMLADTLAVSARAAHANGLDAICALHPPEAIGRLNDRLDNTVPTQFRVVPQRGDDLGARMEWATREAAAGGAQRILLRGSDSPTLDVAKLERALRALDDNDLVVCPDLDGGYNLIGMRRPAPGLFDHPMSTRAVLEDTLANAQRLGLRAEQLEPGFDIDTAADVERLALARSRSVEIGDSVTELCPRSCAFLDREGLWSEPEPV